MLWLLYLCGQQERKGTVREFGMDIRTLLCLKWITSKNLLCGTGNSAQWYVAAWMGEEFGEEWIHVYVWLSRFAVPLKPSALLTGHIPQYKKKKQTFFLIKITKWRSLFYLKKEMATHSSIPAWRIPWTEEPAGLQFMVSQSWTRLSDTHTGFYQDLLYSLSSWKLFFKRNMPVIYSRHKILFRTMSDLIFSFLFS